jgi:hypothetical protein
MSNFQLGEHIKALNDRVYAEWREISTEEEVYGFWLALARADPADRARAALAAIGDPEEPPVMWVGRDREGLLRAVAAAAEKLTSPADGGAEAGGNKAPPDGANASGAGEGVTPAGWPAPHVVARTLVHSEILTLLEPFQHFDLGAIRTVVGAAWYGARRYPWFRWALWDATRKIGTAAAAADLLMEDPQLAKHLHRALDEWTRTEFPYSY